MCIYNKHIIRNDENCTLLTYCAVVDKYQDNYLEYTFIICTLCVT